MISSGTLHVIGTELVVGTFVLSGIAFLMLFLQKGVHSSDIVAHWALFTGLVFTPLAIFSGISASPNGPEGNVMLFNKFLLSCAAIGLSVGLLWNRYQNQSTHMNRVHALLGMVTVCLILITASFGGMYSRGESLTPFLPKDVAFVFPAWASVILLIMGLIMAGKSAVEHR
ncbi:MAG: hypothetical protein VYB50_01155 [Candidatus Thermoplasmatota archaeon]|nr:hypothetical protein [Candidatus Thermoplasmatota archaeon]